MRALTVVALLLATSSAVAQDLVTVPVTVTSLDRSDYTTGLTAADFKISENGDRQEIASLTRERVPVSLAIVIDSSNSMLNGMRRQLAAEAVDKVVAALGPQDEITVLLLSRTVDVRVPWTLGKDITGLNWDGWNPSGVASLHDGLEAAFERLGDARNQRHAIVVLTPGFESSSRMSLANIVKSRRASETALYAFGLGSHRAEEVATEGPKYISTGGTDALRSFDPLGSGGVAPKPLMQVDILDRLVGDSGGTVMRVLSMPEATMAARNLMMELQNQYVIGFTSKKAPDGKYRKLKVELNRKGHYLRYRGGYLATP